MIKFLAFFFLFLLTTSLRAAILPEPLHLTEPEPLNLQSHLQDEDDQNDVSETAETTDTQDVDEPSETPSAQNKYDVIVVGSGIAGTSAAYDLAKNGKKVLILEANGYVGGRTKSTAVTLNDNSTFWFEEGANWIHGRSPQNPLTDLATKVPNVKYIATDYNSMTTLEEEGIYADEKMETQDEDFSTVFGQVQQQKGMSTYDALAKVAPEKLTNKFFMFKVSTDVEFETSSNIKDLSAEYGQDDAKFEGEESMIVSRYQAFAEYLSKHQNIKILLNHPVSRITSTGENSSTVSCSNGQTFTAQKVIIAVPLGVLQKNSITFTPALTDWKVEAVSKLRMGNVCKVLIVPKRNLSMEATSQTIAVVSEDIEKRGAATFFINIAALASVPAYMTFGLGPNSDEIENMPEADLKNLIARRMNAFTSIATSEFDIVKSTWRGNPNIGGAYTYSGLEATREHWENMAKPVFDNGWYFCGEHTNSKYRGTVHGAFLSGKHASEYMRNGTKEDDWVYADRS